ncbi:hypothetical protein JCM19235_4537 [Vibrio maritimus]|uniref:Uncharacterized protein n=1 Tax=Vibrio maritimus TaxID=990268 RepID=A0A090SLR5_9VIBR|nr:hypothetical protein JCM19235_4537 [Vibrio maritimus]
MLRSQVLKSNEVAVAIIMFLVLFLNQRDVASFNCVLCSIQELSQ